MKTYYYELWVAFVLLATPIFGQDRPAYWVHGLNDNRASSVWDTYNALFAAERRLGPTTNGRYNTTQGITGFANLVRNPGTNPFNQQALAIGHSMGGLAVREVARQEPTHFGGMILCGAPLRC